MNEPSPRPPRASVSHLSPSVPHPDRVDRVERSEQPFLEDWISDNPEMTYYHVIETNDLESVGIPPRSLLALDPTVEPMPGDPVLIVVRSDPRFAIYDPPHFVLAEARNRVARVPIGIDAHIIAVVVTYMRKTRQDHRLPRRRESLLS